MLWGVQRLRHGVLPAGPATLLLALGAVGVVAYAGTTSLAAAVLLACTALAASPWRLDSDVPAIDRLLAGIAIVVAVVGWLLPIPLHDRRVYLLIALALAALRWQVIVQAARRAAGAWSAAQSAAPGSALLAALALVLVSLGTWLPSMNYDDNAAHLLAAVQVLRDGYYHLDVATQAWAVAPWTNNVLNVVATVLAGEEARPAVNLLWIVIGASGAWRLAASLQATVAVRWLAVATWASLPMTTYFATTLQVDGASAAVLLHLAATLVNAGRGLPPVVVTAVLFALLAGLKISNVVYALPALAWLGWRAAVQHRWAWPLQLVALVLLLAGSSYAYAWALTGNPAFPLFNAWFKSPLFPPIDLIDPRWMQAREWSAIWGLTFDTNRYGEFYAGAFGWTLLALLPALLLAASRDKRIGMLALWGVVSGAAMFWQIQYMRYLFPAQTLLAVAGAVGLGRMVSAPWRMFAAVLLVLGNLALIPATSWLLRENPWRNLLADGPGARARVERERIPERGLLRLALLSQPDACILMASPEAPFGAIAGGRALTVKDPYDARMAGAAQWAQADPSGHRWQELMRLAGITHVITQATPHTALQQALQASGFLPMDRVGGAVLWVASHPESRHCDGRFMRARDIAHRHLHPWDSH